MADSLRKVQTGQKFSIPAAAYNAFVDAALDHRSRTSQLDQKPQRSLRRADIVLVRNDSGAAQGQLAVLGVDAPVIAPSISEGEFRNRVALSCVTPTAGNHEGRFVVLVEPLPAGAMGRAFATGVCPVQLDVADEQVASTADIADGVSTHLVAGTTGSAVVLWRAGGTGVQWALVRLGGSPQEVVRAYQAVTDESNGEIDVQQVNSDGSLAGDIITAKVLP